VVDPLAGSAGGNQDIHLTVLHNPSVCVVHLRFDISVATSISTSGAFVQSAFAFCAKNGGKMPEGDGKCRKGIDADRMFE
jgi:hypothetical protein